MIYPFLLELREMHTLLMILAEQSNEQMGK